MRLLLLDHGLLDLAAHITSKWKVHKGKTKWIFKQAVQSRLPAHIVNRAKRGC